MGRSDAPAWARELSELSAGAEARIRIAPGVLSRAPRPSEEIEIKYLPAAGKNGGPRGGAQLKQSESKAEQGHGRARSNQRIEDKTPKDSKDSKDSKDAKGKLKNTMAELMDGSSKSSVRPGVAPGVTPGPLPGASLKASWLGEGFAAVVGPDYDLDEAEAKLVAESWRQIRAKSAQLQASNASVAKAAAGKEKTPPAVNLGTAGASSRPINPMSFEEQGVRCAQALRANTSWIRILLQQFDGVIVASVNGDDSHLAHELNILALRLNKEAVGGINIEEFQGVLLSTLRSMLPTSWDNGHESAWIQFWRLVKVHLQHHMRLPGKYEAALQSLIASLSAAEKQAVGRKAFDKLFDKWPKSEDSFKQSNSRLFFIVVRIVDMALSLIKEPKAMVDEITALGLRHLMYGIPTKFVAPFVSCIIDAIQAKGRDPLALEGFAWSLSVIGTVMVRTIDAGSNPLLSAIMHNDAKKVKRALSSLPRADRAGMALGMAPATGIFGQGTSPQTVSGSFSMTRSR